MTQPTTPASFPPHAMWKFAWLPNVSASQCKYRRCQHHSGYWWRLSPPRQHHVRQLIWRSRYIMWASYAAVDMESIVSFMCSSWFGGLSCQLHVQQLIWRTIMSASCAAVDLEYSVQLHVQLLIWRTQSYVKLYLQQLRWRTQSIMSASYEAIDVEDSVYQVSFIWRHWCWRLSPPHQHYTLPLAWGWSPCVSSCADWDWFSGWSLHQTFYISRVSPPCGDTGGFVRGLYGWIPSHRWHTCVGGHSRVRTCGHSRWSESRRLLQTWQGKVLFLTCTIWIRLSR